MIRAALFVLAIALVPAAFAQAKKCTPATSNAVIYDNATKQVVMIVKPDCEEQLDDPAFNPKDHTQVRLAKPVYNAGYRSAIRQLVPDVKTELDPVPPEPPKPCDPLTEDCTPVEEPIEPGGLDERLVR